MRGGETEVRKLRSLTLMAGAGGLAVLVAACGTGGSTSTSASATVPSGLGVSSFDSSFSAMGQLKGLTAAGSGKVAVILPDTTSSTRYVNFDAPYLKKAFDAAGYSTSNYKIDNAQGNEATELQLAQSNITAGRTVLILDRLERHVS